MTSMVAAAPAMTSMYAAPASVYTQAVPTTTAVAAPVATTVAPSYVAAPQAAMPQFAAPAPVSLTAGLADPSKLEAERVAYEKALGAQLDKQSRAVLEEASIKKKMLEQTKTQLEQYKLQVDENCVMACLQV